MFFDILHHIKNEPHQMVRNPFFEPLVFYIYYHSLNMVGNIIKLHYGIKTCLHFLYMEFLQNPQLGFFLGQVFNLGKFSVINIMLDMQHI